MQNINKVLSYYCLRYLILSSQSQQWCNPMKKKCFLITLLSTLLTGCGPSFLNPKGAVAATQKTIFIDSLLLMLIVVIPVIIMSIVFIWRYRANHSARYRPDWDHSNAIEWVCWIIPSLITIGLAVIAWVSTHRLDPYRALSHPKKPVIVQVVALNWKWLFIYPEQGIAAVNLVKFPVNRPVRFLITSDAPMNSFQIPELGSQIYAMSGMRTKLNLIANHLGTFEGRSTNYSGEGFSGMLFQAQSVSDADFAKWVATVKQEGEPLSPARYNALAKDSQDNPIMLFSSVKPKLFHHIMMKYAGPDMVMSHD